ncbi:hypothetical protein [Paenibacillus rubinfantis]|uniref:hypothetical protein n=1 Tax=Paenibacillus rubinfantis TaxID=1720296 RepID=UPI000A5033DA|nr:hypothetical protein [Paenibacillus rubinfantis]
MPVAMTGMEVFRHLPDSLHEFMLATSALCRMNGPLSGAVAGQLARCIPPRAARWQEEHGNY